MRVGEKFSTSVWCHFALAQATATTEQLGGEWTVAKDNNHFSFEVDVTQQYHIWQKKQDFI